MGTMIDLSLLDEIIKPRLEEYLRTFPEFKGHMRLYMFDGTDNGDDITVHIRGRDSIFPSIQFSLTEYPGNCGIIISHNMILSEPLRGKGIAQELQKFKEEIAKLYGYSFMRCTTVENNEVEIHIIKKFGWLPIRKFLNNRTGNWCVEWEKKL